MPDTVHRCPDCSSSVVLERDMETLGLVCMGCSRRWTRPTEAQIAARIEERQLMTRLRADSAAWRARSTPRRAVVAAAV